MERKDPKEKKCAICGKDIYAGEEWAYKIRPQKGQTLFFCKYSHKRQYEKEHPEKKVDVIAQAAAEEEKKPKKVPTERGCIARSLIDVIRHGGNPIEFMREQGYKNPYEAYSSVRHYCETNEPHLAEVLKPLKELQIERKKPTGRPRKAEVLQVDKVPEVGQTTETEIREAANVPLKLQGGVNYQLQVDETMKVEVKPFGGGFHYQGFKVTGIETNFGRFDWNVERTLITFTYEDEEINILPGDWKKMAEQLPEILTVLGVTGK